MSAKLGEILVRENLISPQHLRQALDYQREHGGRLGFNLVKLGLVSDDTITAILSRQYGIPSVNLDLFDIDDDDKVPGVQVRRVLGPMLAAEDGGDLHRQPAHDLVGSVDDEPALGNLVRFGHEG